MRAHLLAAAAVALTLPGLVACGSDGQSSAPTTSSTTLPVETHTARSTGATGPLAPGASAAATSTEPLATATVVSKVLEDDIKAKLTAGGNEIDSVDCPDKIEAREGATTSCTVKAKDGREATYLITLTSLDGEKVLYNAVPTA